MSEQKNTTSNPTNQAQIHVGKMADNGCDDHLDEEVRFYCEDCNVLICDDCVQSIHKTHDFKSFKKIVKEMMDTDVKTLDVIDGVDFSKDFEKGRKRMEAERTEEVTIYKAQAEKIVNKINQIRDQKEREIQKMIEKNEIALQQLSLYLEERVSEPIRKLKQLFSEPGRANDREIVMIFLRLKDLQISPNDKRLEHTVFTPTFVPAEIDEIAIEKLFGELEIEKKTMNELFGDIMKQSIITEHIDCD